MLKKISGFILTLSLAVIVFSCSGERHFKFAVFSDTHIMEGTKAAEDLRAAVQDANGQDLDFVLVSGDITDMNIGNNLKVAKQILDSLTCPYYIIPGNHDTKWSGSGGYNFTELWGDDKFLFDYEGFTFIGLHQGPVIRMDDGHVSSGDLIWLENMLENLRPQDKPLILVTHYPIDPSVDNWYELSDRLKPYNVKLVIHGHGHRNRQTNYEGIPAVMVRSTLRAREKAGGYAIAEVNRDSIFFRERLSSGETKPVWAKLSLTSPRIDDPNYYERPDYSVNDSFPDVSIRWKQETGNTMTASPLLLGKQVYVGNAGGDLMCLDLEEGTPEWTYSCNGPIYATAAGTADRIVFASADSFIYAVKKENGEELWRFKTRAPNIAVPVIHEGTVLFGSSDSSFRALDLETGELLWEYHGLEGYVETKPLIYQGKVIFGAWDEAVYALSVRDGTLIWKWHDGRPGKLYSPAACWPVASGGMVYIVAPDRFLTAINSVNGETIWRTNRHKVRETIGISTDGESVYARCMRDTVFAISTGSMQYREEWIRDYDYGYDIATSMPMEKDGILYFGTKNGLIAAADAKNGKLLWKHKLGNALINTVTPVDDSRVLVSNMDGIVALVVK